MENAAIGYLYTLAVLSMTFVGFTALVAILRQTAGGRLTRLDIFLSRTFIKLGLIATGVSMLVPLLAPVGNTDGKSLEHFKRCCGNRFGKLGRNLSEKKDDLFKSKTPARVWSLLGLLGISVAALIYNVVMPTGGLRSILYTGPVTAILFVGAMWLVTSLYFLITTGKDQSAAEKNIRLGRKRTT